MTSKQLFINLIFGLLLTFCSYAQKEIKDDFLNSKLDSIIAEADLLYSYEKVAWKATDIFMANNSLRQNFGAYIVYHDKNVIYGSFFGKKLEKRLAKYSFKINDLSVPLSADYKVKKISKKEKMLLEIKSEVISQLSDPQYNISFPNGYSPNLVLLEEATGYKLYIIMGTSHPEIIPFGNDYLFKTDKKGKITSWRKFHRTMIPAQTKMANGDKVVSVIHTHLKMTPYISATDICTFRLYGEIYGMNEFMVLSTALGKYFKYILKTNTVEVSDIK